MVHPMPKPIPERFRDLIEQPNHAALATVLPNGTPQVTLVWFSIDAARFISINTVIGRLKGKAIRVNPYVALAISDPANPNRYIQLRGPVIEMTEGPEARVRINALAKRYMGVDIYPGPLDEARVILTIAPEHVHTFEF
jgi:PPOX class probable F420-dependent enzyme